jgi:hypothetical protein
MYECSSECFTNTRPRNDPSLLSGADKSAELE